MKYIIGFLVAVVLFISGLLVRPVLAEWVQPLAWNPEVAPGYWDGTIHRFEWFNDVCYTLQGGQGRAISCVKK